MDSPDIQSIKWHTEILPTATKKAMDYLATEKWLKKTQWYLAGGTALALQEGHRSSVDLDFFLPQKDFSSAKLLNRFPKNIWGTDILREGTIYGKLFKAKTSFIAYPFFKPAKSYKWYGNIKILDKHDIAIMKIIAISQRGRKRDFIDLYWYCLKYTPLINLIKCLQDQYPNISHNYHHIIKSLTYFDDAENDPMPKLFFKASWKDIKDFFKREIKQIAKKLLL